MSLLALILFIAAVALEAVASVATTARVNLVALGLAVGFAALIALSLTPHTIH